MSAGTGGRGRGRQNTGVLALLEDPADVSLPGGSPSTSSTALDSKLSLKSSRDLLVSEGPVVRLGSSPAAAVAAVLAAATRPDSPETAVWAYTLLRLPAEDDEPRVDLELATGAVLAAFTGLELESVLLELSVVSGDADLGFEPFRVLEQPLVWPPWPVELVPPSD